MKNYLWVMVAVFLLVAGCVENQNLITPSPSATPVTTAIPTVSPSITPVPTVTVTPSSAPTASPSPTEIPLTDGWQSLPSGEVTRNLNSFAMTLFSKTESGKNAFLSPYSISTALAMVKEGAAGETEKQLRTTLGLPKNGVKEFFNETSSALESSVAGFEFKTANAQWIAKSFALRQEFVDTLKRYYSASAYQLDFAGNPQDASDSINAWVSNKTNARIKDLVKPEMFDGYTRLVLTNAVYFNASWLVPFDAAQTLEKDFFVQPSSPVKVQMMSMVGSQSEFSYGESGQAQVLAMPYQGWRAEMLVVLPKQGVPLEQVEANLSKIIEQTPAYSSKVDISLPRFSFTSAYSLNDWLASAGIVDAFDPAKADFSRMDGNAHNLFISSVLHKAFVKVNEAGTEAAAATAIIAVGTSYNPALPKVFNADHPFDFVIRDTQTGLILFVGRVSDPTQAG